MDNRLKTSEQIGSKTLLSFRPINIQPNLKDKFSELNICPHFDLLQEVSNILGLEKDQLSTMEQFCGVTENFVSNIGPMCGRKGLSIVSRTACDSLYFSLSLAIKFSETYLDSNHTFLFAAQAKKGETYLNHWASIVPPFKNRKRTAKECLRYVKKLKERLGIIVDGKITDNIFERQGMCALKPKSNFVGVIS